VCGEKVQNSGENIQNSGEYKLHHILLDVDLSSSLQHGAIGTLFRFSTSRLGKETYANLLPKEFADGKSRMTHIMGDGKFFPASSAAADIRKDGKDWSDWTQYSDKAGIPGTQGWQVLQNLWFCHTRGGWRVGD
jgi:hypothetical protein